MTTILRLGLILLSACVPAWLTTGGAVARTLVVHEGALDVQQSVPGGGPSVASAMLTQCVTTGTESERSLTVSGQMTLVAGSSRMQMRTYLVQRNSGELQFHMISAPGLGAWVEAQAGVKTYKDLRQVTNLAVPATYRAVLNFRWLGAHGRVVRRMQLTTSRCVQPALAPPVAPALPASSAPALATS